MVPSWLEKEIFGMKHNKQKTKHRRFTVGKALAKPKAGLHPVKELAIGFSDWVRKLRSIIFTPHKPVVVLPPKNNKISPKKDVKIQPTTEVGENNAKTVKKED